MKEKLNRLQRLAARTAAVAVPLGLVAGAHADGGSIDVSATVSTITGTLAPIGLIGVAVLGVVVAVKAYGWVKRAIS